jgi:outer membrane lipoprotein-sorting protein
MKKQRILRYSLPVAVVASTFAITSLGNVMSADAQTPNLPAITAAELLAKVQQAQVPAFSGTVELKANLGLPNLSGFGGSSVPSSAVQLLMGTHTANIAADGLDKVKVTMTGEATESSWIRNGADAWAWDSSNQSVKHAKSTSDTKDGTDANDGKAGGKDSPAEQMNPATTAADLLASVDPSTTVSVRTTAYVAGRAAYELVLTPKSANSTVGEVVLSVDAATGTPLEARITAKGATKPAFEIGFTAVTFATPAASTFQFTPPPGATVTEVSSISDLLPISSSRRHRHGDDAKAQTPAVEGAAEAGGPEAGGNGGGVTTVGTAWETVVVMENGSSASQLTALMGSAKDVKLADGSTARMLSTNLVNVLVAADGRVAVGAVNAAGLSAALAQPVAAK